MNVSCVGYFIIIVKIYMWNVKQTNSNISEFRGDTYVVARGEGIRGG